MNNYLLSRSYESDDQQRQALAHYQRVWPNTDYAHPIRQQFIADNDPLELKRQALRERMHAAGRALIGEEALAQRMGWKQFKYVPNRDYPEQS